MGLKMFEVKFSVCDNDEEPLFNATFKEAIGPLEAAAIVLAENDCSEIIEVIEITEGPK